MARKQAANAAASPTPDSPTSPSIGAMDSLFEKLRAAAPQNRDQRDRRRRARLKEKHETRLASGEQMPDLADLTRGAEGEKPDSPGLVSPVTALPVLAEKGEQSGSEDVADRAAQMLQAIHKETATEGTSAGSIRVRRRREGNEEERRTRRRRRAAEDSSELSPTIDQVKGKDSEGGKEQQANGGQEQQPGTPVTTVSPPSPKHGTEARPVSISD